MLDLSQFGCLAKNRRGDVRASGGWCRGGIDIAVLMLRVK